MTAGLMSSVLTVLTVMMSDDCVMTVIRIP
jgi:hypothetical protein